MGILIFIQNSLAIAWVNLTLVAVILILGLVLGMMLSGIFIRFLEKKKISKVISRWLGEPDTTSIDTWINRLTRLVVGLFALLIAVKLLSSHPDIGRFLSKIWLSIVNSIGEEIDVIFKIILGVAGFFISWAVLRQSKQQMKDTWIRSYAEIHSTFWNDPTIQEVRCWLAYPKAYNDLRSILLKRQALCKAPGGRTQLTYKEYSKLDKLDKYLNILLRAVTLNRKIYLKKDFWNALHFKYWLCACLESRKPELIWYVQKFYSQLYDFCQTREMREYGKKIGFKLKKMSNTICN